MVGSVTTAKNVKVPKFACTVYTVLNVEDVMETKYVIMDGCGADACSVIQQGSIKRLMFDMKYALVEFFLPISCLWNCFAN